MIFKKLTFLEINDLRLQDNPKVTLHYDFLSLDEQEYLISVIDSLVWEGNIRSQNYGYSHPYRKKSLISNRNKIPKLLNIISNKLQLGYNQLLITEFLPNQGKKFHRQSKFQNPNGLIIPLLESVVVMIRPKKGSPFDIYLPIGSLLVINMEYASFEISATKYDSFPEGKKSRKRKILLSFFQLLNFC